MKKRFLATLALSTAFVGSSIALEYDDVLPNILDSGNLSGGWTTTTTVDGLTLGLRARNIDNNSTANNLGEYEFAAGSGLNTSLSLWNYEFSISGSQGILDKYNFYLGIDANQGAAVDYTQSLFNQNLLDASTEGTSDGLNFIQGSQNIVNYVELGLSAVDHNAPGVFDYRLFAVEKLTPGGVNSPLQPHDGNNPIFNDLPTETESAPVADVYIRVNVTKSTSVPDAGSTWAFLSLSLVGLAGLRRRFVA